MELIEILTRLLMGLFMSFIIGTAASPPPVRPPEPPVPNSSGGPQPFRSYVTVLDVQVVVMESFPMQVALEVLAAISRHRCSSGARAMPSWSRFIRKSRRMCCAR